MKRPRNRKMAARQPILPESDEHFAYIVGYTEGGFPYGITWEEMREMEMTEKKHEAGKASNEPMELQPEPIVGFFARFGIPVVAKRFRGGVSIHTVPDKTPLARLVPDGKGGLVEILWWSHRERWESIGDFGGVVMPLREALQYIVDDELGCFCGSIF